MPKAEARRRLLALLRLAYSGELAAARAYAGHWRSLGDPEARRRIRAIEREELAHRARLGEMLATLGGRPGRLREIGMGLIGWAIALLCFVGGWYVPMVGAGRIERRNIREYEDAARWAFLSGHGELVDELLGMAEVEWDHERYFHDQAQGHWLYRVAGRWPSPPSRAEIRASFAAFAEGERPAARAVS